MLPREFEPDPPQARRVSVPPVATCRVRPLPLLYTWCPSFVSLQEKPHATDGQQSVAYWVRLLIVEGQAQKAEPDDGPEFLGEIAKQRLPIVIPPQRFRHADQRVVARSD